MALSQSLKFAPYMVELEVTTGAASGTIVGPSVGAGTLVLSAGVELVGAVGTATTHTITIGDGTTNFLASTDINSAAAGTFKVGNVVGVVAAADTIDMVQTVAGTATAATARIWAIVCDVNEGTKAAAEVDRDTLA
jgi:hypothetical protein